MKIILRLRDGNKIEHNGTRDQCVRKALATMERDPNAVIIAGHDLLEGYVIDVVVDGENANGDQNPADDVPVANPYPDAPPAPEVPLAELSADEEVAGQDVTVSVVDGEGHRVNIVVENKSDQDVTLWRRTGDTEGLINVAAGKRLNRSFTAADGVVEVRLNDIDGQLLIGPDDAEGE